LRLFPSLSSTRHRTESRSAGSRPCANLLFTIMASLKIYPPSDTQSHTSGPFSPVTYGYGSTTFSQSTQSPPMSPLKYNAESLSSLKLPPATDSLIPPEQQPSLTARLHRRKKAYQGPTAPPQHASQPYDPVRAARLAWRVREEYAEQVRAEEERMRETQEQAKRERAQKEYGRSAAPGATAAPPRPTAKRAVKSKWHSFLLWWKLGFYRFTRAVKNIFK